MERCQVIVRSVGSFYPQSTLSYKASALFVRAKTNNVVKFEGGNRILQPIQYAELNGGAFQRGQTFDTSYVNSDTALQFLIKFYYTNVTLYGVDDVLNRGIAAAIDHVKAKLVNAAGKMGKLLATDLYLDGTGTNSGTLQIDGLQQAVDNGKKKVLPLFKSDYKLETPSICEYAKAA